MIAHCPECDTELNLPEDTLKGDLIQCLDASCNVWIEITSINPLTLEMSREEELDWGE